MADINSTYGAGLSRTISSGTGSPLSALIALLEAEHRRPAAGPAPVIGGRGPGMRQGSPLRSGGPTERASQPVSLPNVDASEGGMTGKKWFAGGFNMSPGYLDATSPGSAQMVGGPGTSPASLSASPSNQGPAGTSGPNNPLPEMPDERPDFYGLKSGAAERARQALIAAGGRRE